MLKVLLLLGQPVKFDIIYYYDLCRLTTFLIWSTTLLTSSDVAISPTRFSIRCETPGRPRAAFIACMGIPTVIMITCEKEKKYGNNISYMSVITNLKRVYKK